MMSHRKTTVFLILAAALVIGLTGCKKGSNWLSFRGKLGSGYSPTVIQPPLAVKWKLSLQFDENSALSFNPPVILDDTIYFGSNDGNFYALDIESGFMRWVFNTDGPINSVPAADEDHVYFGSNNGFFYCVSREDGKEVWSYDTGSKVQSSTIIYEDNVVFTSDVGATYIFSPLGLEKHQIPNWVWLYHTFQVFEDIMYFAPGPENQPYSLGAYDIVNKGYLWLIDTSRDNATWYSFAALKGKSLFYGTAGYPSGGRDLTYYALDQRTGDIIWEYSDISYLGERAGITGRAMFLKNMRLLDYLAPSLWKNLVIYTSGDSVVRTFNKDSGALVWQHLYDYPTSSAPTVAADRVYFGLHGDNLSGDSAPGMTDYTSPKLICLSARNGKSLWELDIEGSLLSAPVIAGKWIVFGTDKNVFYVLEEIL
jgi:outer membrane protein assembly factor BamB